MLACLLVQQVNKDCYSAGWIMKIKLSDKSELNNLLDADAYKKVSGGWPICLVIPVTALTSHTSS